MNGIYCVQRNESMSSTSSNKAPSTGAAENDSYDELFEDVYGKNLRNKVIDLEQSLDCNFTTNCTKGNCPRIQNTKMESKSKNKF